MPVAHWRVSRLAREASLDGETATLVLMEEGFDVSSPHNYVRRGEISRAREALRAYVEGPRAKYTPEFQWPRMRREPVRYLDVAYVDGVHEAITVEFRGTEDAVVPEGVKDRGLLESAVMRPQASPAKYPNVSAASAALVHSLIHNHPFHNGNKRTALVSLVVFLEDRNGRYLDFSEDEVYDLIVRTASHDLLQGDIPERHEDPHFADREVLAIYEWVVLHTSEPEIGDHRIRWGQLETLLRRHDCDVENRGGNRRFVRRGSSHVFTGARNAGSEIDPYEIRRIRRELCLDEVHGYDAPRFYRGEAPHADVRDVIGRYRGVLVRLALLDRT